MRNSTSDVIRLTYCIVGLDLPKAFAGDHPGPQSGIAGSWKLTGVYGRTLDLHDFCGGGIVSHPGGPAAGVPLDDHVKELPEPAQSIRTFAGGKGA